MQTPWQTQWKIVAYPGSTWYECYSKLPKAQRLVSQNRQSPALQDCVKLSTNFEYHMQILDTVPHSVNLTECRATKIQKGVHEMKACVCGDLNL